VFCACRLKVRVDSTKVSLAFALDGDAPQQQDVFAFLPVRRYGLNFVVQVRRMLLLLQVQNVLLLLLLLLPVSC
jgi:hypothetical protein